MRNKSAMRITIAFLGVYAGVLAIQHGVFECLQGYQTPNGLIFNAIGPPCQPDLVWHACYPAMTLIPNLFITGITAILVGLGMAVWALAYGENPLGRMVMVALSVLALLVGGGFVPVFIGIIAAVASRGLGRHYPPRHFEFLAAIWPWPLVLMALWLPGSWLLGYLFSAAMLSAGGVLFVLFDLSLPMIALVSGLARPEGFLEK